MRPSPASSFIRGRGRAATFEAQGRPLCAVCGWVLEVSCFCPEEAAEVAATRARQDEKRKRRNRTRRARDQARRDLGLVRTPYGWE